MTTTKHATKSSFNTVIDNEEENIQVLYLVTPSEMLRAGLKLLGFTKKQYRNRRKQTIVQIMTDSSQLWELRH